VDLAAGEFGFAVEIIAAAGVFHRPGINDRDLARSPGLVPRRVGHVARVGGNGDLEDVAQVNDSLGQGVEDEAVF